MARAKREQSPIGAYHVLLRSSENLFLSEDDKNEFKKLCIKYFGDNKALYSFAAQSDRIHLVFSDGGEGAAAVIKPLTTSYARYYNRVHKRTGKLFADRYKSRAAADNGELTNFIIYVDSTYGVSELCDRETMFSTVCTRTEYERRMSGRLETVCLDAFDAFGINDILNIICRMSGITCEDFDTMTSDEKRAAVRTAASCRWVSVRRMNEAAGLDTAATVKKRAAEKGFVKTDADKSSKTEKDEKTVSKASETTVSKNDSTAETENDGGKRNLSVWLL